MDLNMRVLKAKIKGLELEGKRLRKQIEASQGEERDRLWRLKRELGFYTRCHLLAYALLRGKPYASAERNSAYHGYLHVMVCDIIRQNTHEWHHSLWTYDRVASMLRRSYKVETVAEPKQDVSRSPDEEETWLSCFAERFFRWAR